MPPSSDSWKTGVSKLKHGLEKADFQVTHDIKDFEAFQTHLEYLFTKYSRKDVATLVNKLYPHFDHVRSFEKAISAAAQNDSIATSVWSAALAVIECSCRHSEHMEETFVQLDEFYKSFPLFDSYITLFPGNEILQLHLRDLFEIYTDFCLHTIKYMERGTFHHIASNLFSSGSRRNLGSIQASWNQKKKDFEQEVKRATRFNIMGRGLTGKSVDNVPTTNMPRLHNYFLGRDEFLEEIHSVLIPKIHAAGSHHMSCLIHAMGGMGKTQAALGYNYAYESEYDYRFWVQAETPTKLVESFNIIARLILREEISGAANAIDAVRAWMETTDRSWLLVFDNVDVKTVETIDFAWPARAGKSSAIIVTSQIEELKHRTNFDMPLKSLSPEDGARLLLKCLRRDIAKVSSDEQELLEEVSEMLGGLPLAIAHIGGYISESKHNLLYFRDFFKQRWQGYVWRGKNLTEQYEKRLEIVWDLALEELPTHAHKLINIMAYLNPDGIPEEWLVKDIAEGTDWTFPRDSGAVELVEMTRSLNKRCLVSFETVTEDGKEEQVFFIHRSLQLALRLKLDQDPPTRQTIFNHAFYIVRRASPNASKKQIPDPTLWPQFQKSNPHSLSLCNAFVTSHPRINGTLGLATLFYDAGFHVWERSNPSTRDGTMLLETAENILNSLSYDSKGSLRADIQCITALLWDGLGLSKRADCLAKRQAVYDIRKFWMDQHAVGGKLDPVSEHMFYNAANDLALSYLQSDRFLEAEAQFEACYKKYKQWGTEDQHPYEYAKYYHNIALVRMYQGRYEEAISISEKGVALKLKTDGKNSRFYWFQYDLACIMLQAGLLQQALDLHLEVLAGREAFCGKREEMTLQSLYTVGATYYHMNNLEEAEKYFKECISRAKKTRWHEGALARTQWHFARVLREQQKDDDYEKDLAKSSIAVLQELLKLGRPAYLRDVSDEIALFDWTQPVFDGRWTGLSLLHHVQNASWWS